MNVLLIILLLLIVISIVTYVIYIINTKGFSSYTPASIFESSPCGVEGLTGMTVSSTPAEYNKVDKFGFVEGSMKCSGSGYTNLNGNICLNEEQKKLLTTRGGNSTTGTKYESK